MPQQALATRPASGQVRISKRTPVPEKRSDYGTLFERTAQFLYPWTTRDYPGFRRGLMHAMGRVVTWGAVAHWRAGRRRVPLDIAEALLERVCAELAAAKALEAQLAAYIASEKKIERRQTGICSVRFDASGNAVTGQGRGGRAY